jgi:hypothetical protein
MTHLPYSSAGPYPHEPQEMDQVFTVVKRGWLNNVCALINDSTNGINSLDVSVASLDRFLLCHNYSIYCCGKQRGGGGLENVYVR